MLKIFTKLYTKNENKTHHKRNLRLYRWNNSNVIKTNVLSSKPNVLSINFYK